MGIGAELGLLGRKDCALVPEAIVLNLGERLSIIMALIHDCEDSRGLPVSLPFLYCFSFLG